MAKNDYKLSEIKNGMFICWSVCTQTSAKHTITLKDKSGKVYFSYSKNNTNSSYQFLGEGHSDVLGELILTVDCPESRELKQSIGTHGITDSKAGIVGFSYEFCIEDWTDEDYNDVYINVVAWIKKG